MKKTILSTFTLGLLVIAAVGADEKATTKIFEATVATPVGTIPPGWRIEQMPSTSVKHIPRELPNGTKATITTPAYVLVPDEKGIKLVEPALRSGEKALSVESTLKTLAETANQVSTDLTAAIEELRVSLPAKPTPPQAAAATPKPKR